MDVLRKTLSANDIGATGSHQSGMVVPRTMKGFFPPLDETTLNPSVWLVVRMGDETGVWRFIHYNNRVVAGGTRDEYRLTRTSGFLQGAGATAGDTVELTRNHPDEYSFRLLRTEPSAAGLVLSTSGPWRIVRLNRV